MSNQPSQFAFVPYEKFDELLNKVNQINETLNNTSSYTSSKSGLGDYINEKEAKNMLNKGTTWFWNKRKAGELKAKKAGNNWYYQRKDIIKFIENGSSI